MYRNGMKGKVTVQLVSKKNAEGKCSSVQLIRAQSWLTKKQQLYADKGFDGSF